MGCSCFGFAGVVVLLWFRMLGWLQFAGILVLDAAVLCGFDLFGLMVGLISWLCACIDLMLGLQDCLFWVFVWVLVLVKGCV